MKGSKTLEELFVNEKWKDSLTEENINKIVNEFYMQVGDKRADALAESLESYKLRAGRSYLCDMQEGIKTYALVLLTGGLVGESVRKRLDPGFVVYLKANQVLSHLESVALVKKYRNMDYKEELSGLSESWLKHMFEK